MKNSIAAIGVLVALLGVRVADAQAAILDSPTISTILSTDIHEATPTTGSGVGTLDLILFSFSNGGAFNSAGTFNGDNANTDLPSGGTSTASESYITSFGDLRNFYRFQFPDGSGGSTVNEIVFFVNVNETGGIQQFDLNDLSLVITYTIPSDATRQNPFTNDIASTGATGQNSIGTTWNTGNGTRIAKLGSDAPYAIDQAAVGIGAIDQFILTGINPFDLAYSDSTRLLVYWNSSGHEGGGEVVFLSGAFNAQDLCGPTTFPCPDNSTVPEPGSMLLFGSGLVGLLVGRSRRRSQAA